MSLNKELKEYWTCQYCGEDTSRELKSELVEPDHIDCILNEIIRRKKEDNEKQG